MPDKETAIMLLAFQYDLGTDWVKVLLETCVAGDIEKLKLLLASEYVDIHAKNDKALLLASHRGQKAVVALLLSQSVYKQEVIQEAIARASVSNNTDIFGLLLDYGVDASVFANVLSSVALLNNWYDTMVRDRLQTADDVQVFDKNLLMYACVKGYKALVELLFDKVINLRIDDVVLRTAYVNGHKDIVDWVECKLDMRRSESQLYEELRRYE